MKQGVPIYALTRGQGHHFFGFHDICPWSDDGRFVLALETDFLNRPPKNFECAVVGVVDTKNKNNFTQIAETRAWNFQQGARQQWLSGKKDTIIYNDYRDGRFVSVICCINEDRLDEKIIPYPIYSVHPSGMYAFGLDFVRMQNNGGYGYRGGEHQESDEIVPEDDGIWKIDLESGKRNLIVSIREVAEIDAQKTSESEPQYITHIVPNAIGTRIAFIHKQKMEDGGFRNRLMISDVDGGNIYHIPVQLSHFNWCGDDEIIAWGRKREFITKLRDKNILNNPLFKPALWAVRKTRGRLRQKMLGDCYLLCKDKTSEIRKIGVGVLTEDGHPSFSSDGKWLITDTYPNSAHKRTLILYNWKTGEKIDIAKLNSLPNPSYGVSDNWDLSEMRSDFHPRWSRDGTAVCFDSVHEGTKQMYVADLKDIVHSSL
jgi:hypothetical protein